MRFFLLFLSFYFLPSLAVYAGELETKQQFQVNNHLTQAVPANPSTQPAPRRVKPTFSEEERRGFDQRGFRNTFLMDSLNGLSDPLAGGAAGAEFTGNEGLSPLSPQNRSIFPGVDPTDVIIPRSGGRR
ncbi:hypothetical protein [Microcoleus sp. FACHB-672]|uniref:hypothetical protein n=1 Tax=Microcoleus sp. FACHB-672 TaxID=2692825 RepID=UPI0016842C4B|nr:hypothetical protein [Microcoleus sp. FACHB-672]MBD2043741.1 hypothetical protein [Microcoleus sp. FACHB-672]